MRNWAIGSRVRTGLGLHIGSSQVSLAELEHGAGSDRLRVRCAGSLDLLPGAVADGHIRRPQVVLEAVRELMIRCAVKSVHVSLALPVRSVLLRRLTVPRGSGLQEWHQRARMEAAAVLQTDPEDLAVDCAAWPVRPQPSVASGVGWLMRWGAPNLAQEDTDFGAKPDAEMAITVAAARMERVHERLELAQALRLEPVALEVEHHAAQRTLLQWRRQQRATGGQGLSPSAWAAACAQWPLLIEVEGVAVRITIPGRPEAVFEREVPSEPLEVEGVMRMIEQVQARGAGLRPDAVLLAGFRPDPDWIEEWVSRSDWPVGAVDPLAGLARLPPASADDPDEPHRPIECRSARGLAACGLALRSLGC